MSPLSILTVAMFFAPSGPIAAALPVRTPTPHAIQNAPDPGTFRFTQSGNLSGTLSGASRFDVTKDPVSGERAFIVALQTGGLDGGVYLVLGGGERPEPGRLDLQEVELDGGGGYRKPTLRKTAFAVYYFEMMRSFSKVLRSTGEGSVEIEVSEEASIRGRFEIAVEGYEGNPRALFGVRKRKATLTGVFHAIPGKVEFQQP